MIGYCATASSGIEIAPIRQMKSATTQAKIGLSMKKLGIDRYRCACLVCLAAAVSADASRFGKQLRPDLVAGGEFLEALDHDPVAGLQPFGDEPLAVLHRAGAHRLDRDAVVVLDHEHFAAAAAVALDRLLRHARWRRCRCPARSARGHTCPAAIRASDWGTRRAASPARYGHRPWRRRTAACRATG